MGVQGDQIGKATGKRVLTDDGTWISVKALDPSIQKEIAENSRKADKDRMERARRLSNRDIMDSDNSLAKENQELKELVRSQGEMLAKLNAKMELGAVPRVEAAPKPKKLTKKQKLQQELEAMGVEYEEEDTIPMLQEKKSEAEIADL